MSLVEVSNLPARSQAPPLPPAPARSLFQCRLLRVWHVLCRPSFSRHWQRTSRHCPLPASSSACHCGHASEFTELFLWVRGVALCIKWVDHRIYRERRGIISEHEGITYTTIQYWVFPRERVEQRSDDAKANTIWRFPDYDATGRGFGGASEASARRRDPY